MPKTREIAINWGAAKDSKHIIVDAAIKCFEEYGSQRISMGDIADAAGISRKTLYRVFEDRPALIQEAVQRRWAKMLDKISNRIAKATSIEEALVEGCVTAISAARKDKLSNELFQNETEYRLEEFLDNNKRISKARRDLWQATIDEGREKGVVKKNLSDHEILEIISGINVLVLKFDFGPAKQRQFLKNVLLPAITVSQ